MNAPHPSRRELLHSVGLLIVGFSLGGVAGCSVDAPDAPENLVRATNPESLDSWLAIARDGSVTVYTGRVDLGTGTEIALAQFAAEELDVPIERVHVVMGDTRLTPDQGKTTASLNMIRGSQPIRVAAAEARAALVVMAAQRLGVEQADLETIDGTVRVRSTPARSVSYGELIGDRSFDITMELTGRTAEDISRGVMLTPRAPLKELRDYKIVGTSVARPDIPAKVAGTFPYIHNIRIPGMVHGRVVRPPAFGAKLLSVSAESIASVPDAEIVRRNDFLGVVAAREEDAVRAASLLRAEWSDVTPLPEMDALYEELPRRAVLSDATTYDAGDIAAGLARGAHRLSASYQFPFQDHAMIGPSCAIADVNASRALIWSGSQWPQGDRSDIAKMLGLPLESVHLIWHEASGSYGRLGCDDAAADAAVMSQLIGRPVRVQWMRHDEHAWEPLSPAMLMNIEGASDDEGRLTAFDYTQYSPSHSTGEKGNHLAWHLIGGAPGHGRMSGAAANLWYDIPAKRARNIYVEPWLRGIYLRSPGGFQSIFAYESFMDEMAALTGTDPLEFRLKNTTDARDHAVLEAVARMSGWQRRDRVRPAQTGAVMTGRGLSLARYGTGESRSALVADVEVERATGRVRVTRCFIAFDCGLVINPDGAINQVEGGLLQGISRALHEEVRFDRRKVTSLNWVDYPILKFTEVPEVQVELVSRPDTPWSSAGEAGTVASASAVANAVYDATGKRVRRLPLTPAYVQSLL
jgi:CO/xanthine dehydrogenase Mo-binding subunit